MLWVRHNINERYWYTSLVWLILEKNVCLFKKQLVIYWRERTRVPPCIGSLSKCLNELGLSCRQSREPATKPTALPGEQQSETRRCELRAGRRGQEPKPGIRAKCSAWRCRSHHQLQTIPSFEVSYTKWNCIILESCLNKILFYWIILFYLNKSMNYFHSSATINHSDKGV